MTKGLLRLKLSALGSAILICALVCASCGTAGTDSSRTASGVSSGVSTVSSSPAASGQSLAPASSRPASSTAGPRVESAARSAAPPGEGASSGSALREESLPPYLRGRPEAEMAQVRSRGGALKPFRNTLAFGIRKLALSLPEGWSLKPSAEDFDLFCGNTAVGRLTASIPELPDGAEISQSDGLGEDFSYRLAVRYQIGKTVRSVDIFRCVYSKSELAILDIRCDAVSRETLLQIAASMRPEYPPDKTGAGAGSYAGRAVKIMILGNSFIGTSQVAGILSYMAGSGGKRLEIKEEPRGYASVQTYAEDGEIMSLLSGGGYDAVFQCGFYGAGSGWFAQMQQKKHASTRLILFPAYNEQDADAERAFEAGGCGVADWKGLLTELMGKGVDKYRLCYDDDFLHTSPLGGFAGACLIYSYLYKEKPPLGNAEISAYAGMIPDLREQELRQIRDAAYGFLY